MTDPIEREAAIAAVELRATMEVKLQGSTYDYTVRPVAYVTDVVDALRTLPAARVRGGEGEFVKALDDLEDNISCGHAPERYAGCRKRVLDLYRAAAPVALKSRDIDAAFDKWASGRNLDEQPGRATARLAWHAAVIALHKGDL